VAPFRHLLQRLPYPAWHPSVDAGVKRLLHSASVPRRCTWCNG
jgi:hypothetical protein